MITIAVLAFKGWVGKTFSCWNIGAGLASQKSVFRDYLDRNPKTGRLYSNRVMFVDADPQKYDLSYLLGFDEDYYENKPGLFDIMTERAKAKDVIVKSRSFRKEYGVITCSEKLEDCYRVEDEDRAFRLKESLESVSNDYDFCLIDTSPNKNLMSANALTAADYIIIPVQTDEGSLRSFKKLYDVIEQTKAGTNPNLKILGLFFNMYNPRTIIAKDFTKQLDEISNSYQFRIFNTRIRSCMQF